MARRIGYARGITVRSPKSRPAGRHKGAVQRNQATALRIICGEHVLELAGRSRAGLCYTPL